ncbi:MAG TPA: methyltransferase domain-containing protein [Gemmatimonadaceae bacterium]|nr:methyltransferase domain-containing protein [Gemmatimonadaceae bacterium]
MLGTPARRRGVEFLDDPRTEPTVRERAMADVARSNRLFGGTRSATRALRTLYVRLAPRATLLDVGTGMADVPTAARADATALGVRLEVFGADIAADLLAVARARLDAAVAADAMRLPFATGSVDVVTCSQMLHHFLDEDARTVIAELHRVARRFVVIADLRRSWVAAGGFWLAAFGLRFHPVTRHDGVVSVMRGFTAAELRSLVRDATGITPLVRRDAFWRLTAVWPKAAA